MCSTPAAPDASDAAGDAAADTQGPKITAMNYTIGDTAGGGWPIVVTGTNLKDVTKLLLGGDSIAFRDATDTSVTFDLPPHRPGELTVQVASNRGKSGNLLFEYWSPGGIDGLDYYLDAGKGVGLTLTYALSTWTDQGPKARRFSPGDNKPATVLDGFGATASIRFKPDQWLRTSPSPGAISGFSYFAVAKWTNGDTSASQASFNVPLTLLSGSGGWSGWGISGATIQYKKYDKPAMSAGAGLNDGRAHLLGMTSDATPTHKFYVGDALQGAPVRPGGVATTHCDTVGAGYGQVDGFDGDLGAVIVVAREITATEISTLNQWARQRFGTP